MHLARYLALIPSGLPERGPEAKRGQSRSQSRPGHPVDLPEGAQRLSKVVKETAVLLGWLTAVVGIDLQHTREPVPDCHLAASGRWLCSHHADRGTQLRSPDGQTAVFDGLFPYTLWSFYTWTHSYQVSDCNHRLLRDSPQTIKAEFIKKWGALWKWVPETRDVGLSVRSSMKEGKRVLWPMNHEESSHGTNEGPNGDRELWPVHWEDPSHETN